MSQSLLARSGNAVERANLLGHKIMLVLGYAKHKSYTRSCWGSQTLTTTAHNGELYLPPKKRDSMLLLLCIHTGMDTPKGDELDSNGAPARCVSPLQELTQEDLIQVRVSTAIALAIRRMNPTPADFGAPHAQLVGS